MKKLSDTYKELGIDFTFPIRILNSNDRETYYENSDGYWNKREYDSNGNKIYFEDSYGYWCRYEYDSDGNKTYRENSWGYWCKCEYDTEGTVTYREDSDGVKRGKPRSQSCDGKVIEVDGKKYKLTEL